MHFAGKIVELWQYPVSSVGGEPVRSLAVEASGITGDRNFVLLDGETGMPAVPERDARWRSALQLTALTFEGDLPVVAFPDGATMSVADTGINEHLSGYFGFSVAIGKLDDGSPDRIFPTAAHRHHHFPVHILTTGSLRRLAEIRSLNEIDVRRFRPTILVETTDSTGFPEDAWVGHTIRVGTTELRVEEKTKRCGVTFIAQPGLDEDPDILRSILRHNKRHFGVYCSVALEGIIQVGDQLTIRDIA